MWLFKQKIKNIEKPNPVLTPLLPFENPPTYTIEEITNLINDLFNIVEVYCPDDDLFPHIKNYKNEKIQIDTYLPSEFTVRLSNGVTVFHADSGWFTGNITMKDVDVFRPGNWIDYIKGLAKQAKEKRKVDKERAFMKIDDTVLFN